MSMTVKTTRRETIKAGRKTSEPAATDLAEELTAPLTFRLSAWPVRVGAGTSTQVRVYTSGVFRRGRFPALQTGTK